VLGKAPDSKPPIIPQANPARSDTTKLAEGEGTTSLLPRGSSLIPQWDEAKERRAYGPLHANLLDGDKAKGIPIAPLDGLTCDEHNTDLLLTVEFKAIAFEKGRQPNPRAKDTFSVGERLNLSFKANRELSIKLLWDKKEAEGNRGKTKLSETAKCLLANQVNYLFPIGLVEEDWVRTMTFTVLAYPTATLKMAKRPFPEGVRLEAEGIHDRIVHRRLYELSAEGRFMPPDPNQMVKVSVRIKILPPAAKND
jgi:hypothetical protein